MYIINYIDNFGAKRVTRARTLQEINEILSTIYNYGGKLLSVKGGE